MVTRSSATRHALPVASHVRLDAGLAHEVGVSLLGKSCLAEGGVGIGLNLLAEVGVILDAACQFSAFCVYCVWD